MTNKKVVDLPQKKISTQMDDILQEIRIYIQSAEMNISEEFNYTDTKRATKFLMEAMALIDDTRLDVNERYELNKGENS